MGLAVIVLAGGESRRFGSDKLVAVLDGRTLLDHALDGIPAGAMVAVVGPERPLSRAVTFLREDPPGGGPAAGLITGLRWALGRHASVIATLPGDAPAGGLAAMRLVDAVVNAGASTEAVVAVDAEGREQVLQLALRPSIAQALIELAGPGAGHGESVRRLLHRLDPHPRQVELSADLTSDIDTTAQLRARG